MKGGTHDDASGSSNARGQRYAPQILAVLGAAFFLGGWKGVGQECPSPAFDGEGFSLDYFVETDDVLVMAESGAGAAGDVVPITLLLRSRVVNLGWIWLNLAVCHDPEVAELTGEPVYSEEFLSIAGLPGPLFYPVGGPGADLSHEGDGFLWSAPIDRFAYQEKFPSEVPMPLMTLYYPLRGEPSDRGLVSFCNFALELHEVRCSYSSLWMNPPGDHNDRDYVPLNPVNGTLTVIEGPVTRPERPLEPPTARVYPGPEGGEAVNFRVRITGAAALPGESEVPVEVHVTADREYTGISLPIDFDERYLRLSWAEDGYVTGVVLVDNEVGEEAPSAAHGHAVLFSGLGAGSRRLAAEGEEVHAATLYFDVLEGAADVEETRLEVHTVTRDPAVAYRPWVAVNYEAGPGSEEPVVRLEAEPVRIAGGLLKIQREPTSLGDVNLDYTLDIADPIRLLGVLFLGDAEFFCGAASDFNEDGTTNVSDPVAILNHLFLGGPGASERGVFCSG